MFLIYLLPFQEKCLEACVQVLREANDLFKSIDDTKVLAEVIDDDRGKRYLEGKF